MALLEFSVVPLGVGESVSLYVVQCIEVIEASGLDYELHAMGTIVEGELQAVIHVMQQCIEKVSESADRVTCTAKIDHRKNKAGSLQSKVASVEQKLGRAARK